VALVERKEKLGGASFDVAVQKGHGRLRAMPELES